MFFLSTSVKEIKEAEMAETFFSLLADFSRGSWTLWQIPIEIWAGDWTFFFGINNRRNAEFLIVINNENFLFLRFQGKLLLLLPFLEIARFFDENQQNISTKKKKEDWNRHIAWPLTASRLWTWKNIEKARLIAGAWRRLKIVIRRAQPDTLDNIEMNLHLAVIR